MEPLVALERVAKSFGDSPIHKDISFSLYPGEVVTLLGPSGTGKTVLFKLIIGLLFPDKGTVKVLGHDLLTLSEEECRKIRLNVGMLFQGAALFDSLTVFENIAFPLREAGVTDVALIREKVQENLALVNLPGMEHKMPSELSGGQKKRVGLARALATNPKILLFDEPTTGLDPTSRGIIDELILMLKKRFSITSLVITHDMESARRISDRLILVSEGVILAEGKASVLWEENEYVRNFARGQWRDNEDS